jgi:hypothetical protein
MKHKREWTKQWPTQSGWYWFYGFLWGQNGSTPPEARPIRMVKISKGVLGDAGGFMIYETEAEGVWQEIDLPILPKGANPNVWRVR